ncbi:dNA-binding protein [Dorea sp. CAG:317]|nr:dNA-binding protein [Dorea sp. CAG:317]
MPMNTVIQEKRKELGLTQEQVAEYLNVSTPAVSKWEKGITSPDISILPQLARFLKIDLNTLFCFTEDMTMTEINYFCREVSDIVQAEGFIAGFKTAIAKLHEYPHNETLLYYMALQLDGHLLMSGMDDTTKEPYEAEIISWYSKLTDSTDDKISNSAKFMLASRYIRSADYEKAQEILDSMPSKEDIISSMADKLMLQVSIYEQQGKAEQAVKELQYALLTAVQKVQLLLNKLVDAELSANNYETAKIIAEKSSQMPELLNLWEYSSFVAPLQVAMVEKNSDTCIALLRKLLNLVTEPWDITASPLFYRIQANINPSQMLPALLSDMEKGSEYEFLRENEEYQKLIDEYKEKLK